LPRAGIVTVLLSHGSNGASIERWAGCPARCGAAMIERTRRARQLARRAGAAWRS
jgi:hypothetical protein